ncbi:hypothetical protein PHYPO_G00081810 [Pangasianodon hypophthalmus]|uniref:CRIB domain-containing protein n=2 Tax=Pangasianodon hypophthalmus TaxID=310915 RepID=A0A5N5LLU1_PANHP|nr:hypothetical protein PHYPO_G00081810 [Pangasianodon hypophthalmus]
MGTRLKVLRTFKALHRTRMTVFKDDDRALTAARLKINEEFKKNKNETSEENIQQMIKMSRAVETILRENILQAEHVGENKLVLRPRESLLLENGGEISARCSVQHVQVKSQSLCVEDRSQSGTASCDRGTVHIGLRDCSSKHTKDSLSLPVEPGVLFSDSSLGPLHTLCRRWHGSTLGLLIMSEFWLCFNCCIAEQPQPKRRRRIDRSMIGEPTNFVHTAHVGSGDLFSGMDSVNSIQNQMQSKGGYGRETIPINVQMQLVDTKAG